jgi:hypothetical protein
VPSNGGLDGRFVGSIDRLLTRAVVGQAKGIDE